MHQSIIEVAAKGDALALSDALEALIAEGQDTPTDREYALKWLQEHPAENTEAYAFARAAITGRVAESRGGLGALGLVGDVAHRGEVSRKLDPSFREGAATRMLGTLYTKAPPAALPNGADGERGLEMLEGLLKKYPNSLENHLRLGEAYLVQGDGGSALPHLCYAQAHKAELRHDDQLLLERLFSDAGNPRCPTAPPAAATPAQPPAR
jgi:hypothetical protein